MSRNLLHKDKVSAFIEWLEIEGWDIRDGLGQYQIFQFIKGDRCYVVYRRDSMPEHVSVDSRADNLVRKFIHDTRNKPPRTWAFVREDSGVRHPGPESTQGGATDVA